MAVEDPNVKDILIALYDRNEQYHDQKDKAMWLSASVYLGFTVGLMAWFLENRCFWEGSKWLFTVFLCVVFVLAWIFILFQNREKCKSARRTELFRYLIKELGERKHKELNYKDLISLVGKVKLPWGSFYTRGRFGLIVLIVLALFFLAQIYLVWG